MVERISGTPNERAALADILQKERRDHLGFATITQPDTSFVSLDAVCSDPTFSTLLDQELLVTGLDQLEASYAPGYTGPFLRTGNIWVGYRHFGTRMLFGGFHTVNQGFRHIQQVSINSALGSLAGENLSPKLVSLDLLRSIAHDLIHFNSYRLYRLIPNLVASRERVFDRSDAMFGLYRVQYGVNFRRADGTPYSLKDREGSAEGKNIGVIMDGATDWFAQSHVRSIVTKEKIERPDDRREAWIFSDVTGSLEPSEVSELAAYVLTDDCKSRRGLTAYLTALIQFHERISTPYHRFLAKYGEPNAHFLHQLLIDCMSSGKIKAFSRYLDAKTGLAHSFIRLFKSEVFH